MFHLVPCLPLAYVAIRFVLPLSLPIWATLASVTVLAVGSQFHLWNRLSSGSVFAPEFPREVVIVLNVLFGLLLFLAAFQLALDVGAGILGLGRGSWVTITPATRLAVAFVAIALSVVGVAQAIRLPGLRQVAVGVDDLPSEFEGYRILQLTDFHASRLFPGSWMEAVVSSANGLDADLVAVTGDLADGTVETRRADVEPLRRLVAPDGVWVIPGNHEYFFGQDAWSRHSRALGMRTLANGHAVIEREGARLVLAGVTDLSAPEFGLPGPDLARALEGAPPGAPVVLLDHQPSRAARAAEAGVSLQLSGHTHGGMILGPHRLVAMANGGFVSGSYQVGRMVLYVGNGTGIWPGFALRLGKPAEMTLFTVHRRVHDVSADMGIVEGIQRLVLSAPDPSRTPGRSASR